MRGAIGQEVTLERYCGECGFEGDVEALRFRSFTSWDCPRCGAFFEEDNDD